MSSILLSGQCPRMCVQSMDQRGRPADSEGGCPQYRRDSRSDRVSVLQHSHTRLFFKGSPKRESALEKAVEEQGELISGTKKRLVDLCRTRWVERHDALVTFADLYPAVVALFQDIEQARSWHKDDVVQTPHVAFQFFFFFFFFFLLVPWSLARS